MADSELYRVTIEIKCDVVAGGATVTAALVVDAASGQAFGSGKITQALAWPNNEHPIHHIAGQIRHTGLGEDHLLVGLQGEYIQQIGGPWTFGQCLMTAALVLDKDWNGVGSFTYGLSGRQFCRHATVTNVTDKQ